MVCANHNPQNRIQILYTIFCVTLYISPITICYVFVNFSYKIAKV